MKALLIEEALDLGDAIASRLRAMGHVVVWATSREPALRRFRQDRFDLIVLDLNLPGGDGADVLTDLRRHSSSTPLMVISDRADVDENVNLLDVGADDYLVKPFDLRELDARVRALMRRSAAMPAARAEIGNVVMDLAARSVAVRGNAIALNRREFRLFELLISRLGQVVPKERLMDQLFGFEGDVGPNALELYVSRVRQKLRESTVRIETVRCVGYVARSDDASA
jgi:two-component system response regulator TctD